MTPITIKIHGIPVVLTREEALALRAALDEHLPPPPEWLADTAWMAGARWMREQAASLAQRHLREVGLPICVVDPGRDLGAAIRDLPLAPSGEAATIEPSPERRGGGDHGRG